MYRVVKLSSPNLNYLIIVGSVLLYTCVYLYVYSVNSFDRQDLETFICNVRLYTVYYDMQGFIQALLGEVVCGLEILSIISHKNAACILCSTFSMLHVNGTHAVLWVHYNSIVSTTLHITPVTVWWFFLLSVHYYTWKEFG